MIYRKLFEIQKMALSITKNAENTFFKNAKGKGSKYVSLNALWDVYQPILGGMNILCYHKTFQSKVRTVLLDMDDDTKVRSDFDMVEENNPQKHGSCITYAKRYNLGQLLNVMTDEDDDGNKASQQTQIEKPIEKQVFDQRMFENLSAKKELYKSAEDALKQISEHRVIPLVFIEKINQLYG